MTMPWEDFSNDQEGGPAIPPELLDAQALVESGGDPNAVSKAGAVGLHQFMPGTAKRFGIDPTNPQQSRDAAGKYLSQLAKQFGSTELALTAYNWGEGNLEAWIRTGKGVNGQEMPPEAQAYSDKVHAKMAELAKKKTATEDGPWKDFAPVAEPGPWNDFASSEGEGTAYPTRVKPIGPAKEVVDKYVPPKGASPIQQIKAVDTLEDSFQIAPKPPVKFPFLTDTQRYEQAKAEETARLAELNKTGIGPGPGVKRPDTLAEEAMGSRLFNESPLELFLQNPAVNAGAAIGHAVIGASQLLSGNEPTQPPEGMRFASPVELLRDPKTPYYKQAPSASLADQFASIPGSLSAMGKQALEDPSGTAIELVKGIAKDPASLLLGTGSGLIKNIALGAGYMAATSELQRAATEDTLNLGELGTQAILGATFGGVGSILHGKEPITDHATIMKSKNLQMDRLPLTPDQVELFKGYNSKIGTMQAYLGTPLDLLKHEDTVASLAVRLGKEMGMDAEDLAKIEVAARAHDAGKAFVPQEILAKKGSLTPEERAQVALHAEKTGQLLREAGLPDAIIQAADLHHAWTNGKFVPEGEQLSDIAKIIAVADTASATGIKDAAHAYLKNPGIQKALVFLSDAEHYDASVVETFKNLAENGKLPRAFAESLHEWDPKLVEEGAAVRSAELKLASEPKPIADFMRSESGQIDRNMMIALGTGALSYTIARGLMDPDNVVDAALTGLAGFALPLIISKTSKADIAKIAKTPDYGLGLVSTRVRNISESLRTRMLDYERHVLTGSYDLINAVHPFQLELGKLDKDMRSALNRALLTNDPKMVEPILKKIGNEKLTKGYDDTVQLVKELGGALVQAKKLTKLREDYLPRVVLDYGGMKKVLGQQVGTALDDILAKGDANARAKTGGPMDDIERSRLINSYLQGYMRGDGKPSYAKQRQIAEITEKLEPFYADFSVGLNMYIRKAVTDIEKARFFGRDMLQSDVGYGNVLDVESSIGNFVQSALKRGEIRKEDVEELSSLIQSRFGQGERASGNIVQGFRNLANMGLLGNPISAASQLGDLVTTMFMFGLRPTFTALVQKLTGRTSVNMHEFGLTEHIAEEFSNQGMTAKWMQKSFKYGGFSYVDAFGKGVTLQAALNRGRRLVATEKGAERFAKEYGAAYGSDIGNLIEDLRRGVRSDLTDSFLFSELSDVQPVTKLEMPQAYLNNPNERVLYMLKSYQLKQLDIIRRKTYNEIKKGNVAKGLKNMGEIAVMLAVSGATTSQIQDWMLGRDHPLSMSDVLLNIPKTFGWSAYTIDQFKKAPTKTVASMAVPPIGMMDDILKRDPKAMRYIPLIGRFLYEHSEAGQAAQEARDKRDLYKSLRD